MNVQNNRQCGRIIFGVSIEYTHENSESVFGAEVCNYSDGGLCFETGYAMRPGSKIKIIMEEEQPDEFLPHIQDKGIAEVKWCKKLPGYPAFFYWVGVEFITKVSKGNT